MSARAAERRARASPAWMIATLGGLGRFPLTPGTAGSVAGLALYWAAYQAGAWLPFVLFILVAAAGLWSAGAVEREVDRKDPPEVVVDEAAGQMLCLLGAEPSLALLAAGLVVFRALDIAKPWRRLESLPGGWGVMADDLAAGAAGWVLLAVARATSLF